MRTFSNKVLIILLDALGSVAMLITVGMLVTLVGAAGALLGFFYASQHGFPGFAQYGLAALCALLAPVLLGVWLWQQVIKPDDDPPRSS